MITKRTEVKNLLEARPDLRERRHRYKAIWNLLYNKYHKDTWGAQTFLIVGPEILSYTREFCKVQADNKELRGRDYNDKEMLEQEVQVNLGYTPGYHQDLKKLDTLVDEPRELKEDIY